MQIDLPIHQAASHEKLFDGIDALDFDHQTVVHHVEHLEQALARHTPLLHAREKGIAAEVVHAVDIELAGDELVEEVARVFVLENSDGLVERALLPKLLLARMAEVDIDLLHHEQRDFLVGDAIDQCVLQDV